MKTRLIILCVAVLLLAGCSLVLVVPPSAPKEPRILPRLLEHKEPAKL